MASPQPDKYTRLSNELLEAICRAPCFNGRARVFFWIVRNSYGWQKKKTAPISVSEMGRAVGIDRKNARTALRGLLRERIVEEVEKGCWAPQKDYDKWYRLVPFGPGVDSPMGSSGPGVNTPQKVGSGRPTPWGQIAPPFPYRKEIFKERKKAGFQDFWEAYPRKRGIKSAETEWNKISPDPVLVKTMLHSIAVQVQSKEWLKDDGTYIPNPATWLRDHRWKDEHVSSGRGPSETVEQALARLEMKYGEPA